MIIDKRIPLHRIGRLVVGRRLFGSERGIGTRSLSNEPAVSVSEAEPESKPEVSDYALDSDSLTPSRVVEILDRYIVGQTEAKRAVAVALRNRWRRHKVPPAFQPEIVPKNILMIGPTGCGKTEIARRLARLAHAPFVKVEATKFTEVGFHGRDVDQIIRDLVDNAITMQKEKMRVQVLGKVNASVESKLVEILTGFAAPASEDPSRADQSKSVDSIRKLLRDGSLEERRIEMEIPEKSKFSSDIVHLNDIISKMFNKASRAERRRVTVSEARSILREAEIDRLLSTENIAKDAIQWVESDGIVFIDEIDKIVTSSENRSSVDASSEGVQRDLLPIIEGSSVSTKHGNVNTDHILFICSGAFHACKPSDMLAELQGRLPIRVELRALTQQDLYRILTEPECNMIKQQQAMMSTEDIQLEFSDEAVHEIASVAAQVNRAVDNIGARRLHTVIERVVEEISFFAPERSGTKCVIGKEEVTKAVGGLVQKMDLSKFVL